MSGLTKMVQARYPDTKKAGMADGKEDSDVHVKKIPIESALSRNISRNAKKPSANTKKPCRNVIVASRDRLQ